jgi:hypothetical protein
MCLLLSVLFLGPRFGLFVYWIGWPARWELVFDGWLAPLIGFVVAPWTTLMWVLCAPGGITGFDYVLVGLAALLDISTLAGSGRSYAERGSSAAAVS